MPGCVLDQGEVPVVGGKFSLVVDPAAAEKAADGCMAWDFKRVVIRGNQVHVAKLLP